MAPTPISRPRIVKKKKTTFKRQQAGRRPSVPESWRKPHGIDSRVRRRFRGAIRMPKIGYGSNKKTRFVAPDGFVRFLVHNVKDLEMLLMHNRKFSAEIAKPVSRRVRSAIVQRAQQLNIKVTNKFAGLTAQENE